MTLAGISSINTMNVLAAAAAAPRSVCPNAASIRGLRTFVLDPERNPGRANVFRLDGRIIVIDYAHNEAGMVAGLTELLNGLRRKGAEVWIAICTAGDRTDSILRAFAFRAAVGSDHLGIAELVHYLRGRSREDIIDHLRAGAREAGVEDVRRLRRRAHALKSMLRDSRPRDVISVTALGMRPEIFAWLERRGPLAWGRQTSNGWSGGPARRGTSPGSPRLRSVSSGPAT